MGPEHYVAIMSFVDKDQIEPGCSVLTHHKVNPFLSFFISFISAFFIFFVKSIFLIIFFVGPSHCRTSP